MNMDAVFLNKAFALIAKGLMEKEEKLQKEPARYPYSKTLQHGINMFLSASCQVGQMDKSVLDWADEASFLDHFITKPIEDWFAGWSSDIVEKLCLQDQPFWGYGAFAYLRNERVYTPSPDCYEFLGAQDRDIMAGTDERALYEKIIILGQETYCKIRKYIIQHPIITLEERRMMLLELAGNQAASEAFQFAYEEITEESFRCPCCGWTMTRGKYGLLCHSPHCTDIIPELTDDMKLDIASGTMFRLKKGVMRYFAWPGRLELAIAGFCEDKGLDYTLWPEMDKFDLAIRFPNSEVWKIDAKAYRNPITLRTKIQNDSAFRSGGFTRGYYVVPTEYTSNQKNYTSVVNKVLRDQKNVRCITLKELTSAILRKEEELRESKGQEAMVRATDSAVSDDRRRNAAVSVCCH